MEELSARCVQLKHLPATATEQTVRECLHQANFGTQYDKIHRYEEKADDIRWLIRFRTKGDAEQCIRKGQWEVASHQGHVEVLPDYCSDCILPLEWKDTASGGQDEDWVMTGHELMEVDVEEPISTIIHRNRLDSHNSDDELFDSGPKGGVVFEDFGNIDGELMEKCCISEPKMDSFGSKTYIVKKGDDAEQPSSRHSDANSSTRTDSWNISVKSDELFGSGKFEVTQESAEPLKAQEGVLEEVKSEEMFGNGKFQITQEGSETLKAPDDVLEEKDNKTSIARSVKEEKKADTGEIESTKDKATYQNIGSPHDTTRLTENKTITADNLDNTYLECSRIPEDSVDPVAGARPEMPLPTETLAKSGDHTDSSDNPAYSNASQPQSQIPGYPGYYTGTPMPGGMPNPGYMPMMYPGYAFPPGGVPSTVPGTQPLYSQPAFYPPVPVTAGMQQSGQQFAGQQPVFYVPMMVMDAEGKMIPTGKIVPMMPGAGAQSVSAATLHTPTTEAPSPPAFSSLQVYEVPSERVYDAWPQEDDKTKSTSGATGLMQDTIYEKINDDLLKTRKAPPLPPRDYAGYSHKRDDAEPLSTQAETLASELTSHKARRGGEKGLKIFDESAARTMEESKDEDEEEDVEELGGCRKVKVKFGRSISKDSLELFFESEKRSGGGDIIEMIVLEEKGEAFLEFKDSSVVDRILQTQSTKEFVLSGTTLHVQKYDPHFDKRRFFISGLSKRTSKESLRMFFEARCHHVPQNIVDGETPGTALLIFDSELVFKDLQSACQQKPLEGAYLVCQQVEVTRSVKVTGCGDNMGEPLTYYFENKRRSQGGDVEQVTRQKGTGAYIVTFKNVEDCELVCRQEVHFINQDILSVCPYYPCLDLDDSLRFTVPGPIDLHDIDPHMKRFLLANQQYHGMLESRVRKIYGQVVWPKGKDDSIKIICTVDKNDKEGLAKVENWSESSLGAVEEVLDRLTVNDSVGVAQEAWEPIKERLGEISIDDPDKVAVYLKKENCTIVVVGEKKEVSTICAQAQRLAAELERQLDEQHQTITKTKGLRKFQIIMLLAAKFSDKFKKSPVEIDISYDTNEVVFKGPKKVVDEAMDKMHQTINSFAKKEISGFPKPARDFLFNAEVRNYIKRHLHHKKVIGVWDITRDQKLNLYSKSPADVDIAETVLLACVKQKTIPLDSHTRAITQKSEWESNLKRLEEGRERLFKVDVYREEVNIVAVESCFDTVVSEIQRMFELHTVMTDFIEVDAGKFRFMCRSKKRELEDIQQQYLRLSVEIITVDEQRRKGFRVKGTKDGCQLAVRKIKQLLDGILLKDCTLTHPYVHEFIHSSQGKDALRKIEMTQSCVLEIAQSVGRSNAPSEPESLASCRLGPSKVEVAEADMTNIIVDAIVSPTNASLDCKVGLGTIILEKAGSEVQRECGDQKRQFSARLKEGMVVATGAGRLPCKRILHLVTPSWWGGSQTEDRALKQAVKNCLEAADKQKLKTLALPLIGFGKDKFPLSSCVKWIGEALADNLRQAGKLSNLEKVFICDIRSAIVKDVITKLTEALKHTAQVVVKREERKSAYAEPVDVEDSGSEGDDSDDDGEMGAYGGRSEPTSVSTGGGIQTSVVVGELAKQKVDAMVNSVNAQLNLNVGMAAKALLRAGGDVIQDECRRKYPSGIQFGELAVTSGGNMACHYIFHGVLATWDHGTGSAKQIMERFVKDCLAEADKRNLRSIAFPALGTGNLGFPVDVVAQLMFDTVARYQQRHPRSSLRQVMFVVYHGDAAATKGFQRIEAQEKRRQVGVSSSAAVTADTFLDKRIRTNNKFKKSFGTLTVEIVQGDITKEQSEVIVNSILRDLNLNTGNVSKAILAAAGYTIQSECDTPENQAKMTRDGVVVTRAGRLPYTKKIFHVESQTSESGWAKIVRHCLGLADRNGFSSMSFPALGTGGKGCSPESVTKAMFEAFRQFADSSSYKGALRTVRIVVFQPEMVAKFVAAAGRKKKTKSFLNPFRSRKPVEQSCVTVYVYAESSTSIRQASHDLEDLLTAEETCHASRIVLQKLEKESFLQDKYKRSGIEVTVLPNKGYIKLRGHSRSLIGAKAEVQLMLNKLDAEVQKSKVKDAQAAVKLPSTWTTMSQHDPLVVIQLTRADADYAAVATRFLTETRNRCSIVKIERIQNPRFYHKFVAKKEEMVKYGVQPNEKSLWHATTDLGPGMINSFGFYTSAKIQTPWGDGAVFVPSAHIPALSRTSPYSQCQRDIRNQCHIYLSEVLVGDYCMGQPRLALPPQKGIGTRYNSTIDTTGSFYVIYEDAQAYPSYHVVFQ